MVPLRLRGLLGGPQREIRKLHPLLMLETLNAGYGANTLDSHTLKSCTAFSEHKASRAIIASVTDEGVEAGGREEGFPLDG